MATTPEISTTELLVTSTSGKGFPISFEVSITRGLLSYFVNCPIRAFGVAVSLAKARHPTQGEVDVLTVGSYSVAKSTVEVFFGKKLPKGADARIQLSPATVQVIEAARQAALAPYQLEARQLEETIQAERAAMPTRRVFEWGYDMGDYSTKTYCRIVAVRQPTAREHAHYLQAFAEHPESYTHFIDGQWQPHTAQSWAVSAVPVHHLADVVTEVPTSSTLVQELRGQPRLEGIQLPGGYELFAVTAEQVARAQHEQATYEAVQAAEAAASQARREQAAQVERARTKDIPAGHAPCWECGVVHPTRKMTYDGGAGWYCGC